jgi:hypothetical protein
VIVVVMLWMMMEPSTAHNDSIAHIQDTSNADDRKPYYDAIRSLWTQKSSLQSQELALLAQLKQQQDAKSSLRSQLLDKQRALLQLGLAVSRRTCHCPVQVRAAVCVSSDALV